jgi:hypothetical protein
MLATPMLTALASPLFAGVLLIVATEGVSDTQVTPLLKFWVELSE